ncbi:MAG: NYN domain-containing protein [Gemmatimonadetes bacterium]|nr:NYN domain-containing protein [Gemmatimonadota bacterium]
MHRGPQALPPTSATTTYGNPFQHAPNAALLIDFDNVTMGIRSDLASELRSLLSSDIIKGKVAVQRAYADWRRYPQYIVPLAESSIDMIMAPAYGSSKKNATDIRLAVDAIELVFTRPEIGTYILLSGDSDFASMVTKLKEYGKYVIGVGIRESSSDLLVMNCDEYYSYNALAGLVKNAEEDVQKWDPWELVVEAIGRMKKNGDVMRSDRLKQVMQDIDVTFDEKNYGYSKFSKFVSDAAEKGLLTITKLENGQLEVGPSGNAPAAAAADKARRPALGDDEAAGARDERGGRRGRRGGRRGGRDRDERGERAAPVAADGSTAGTESASVDAEAPLELQLSSPVDEAKPAEPVEARTAQRQDSRSESRTESRTESRGDARTTEGAREPRRESRSESRHDAQRMDAPRADTPRADAPRPERGAPSRPDGRAEPRAESKADARDDIGLAGERLTRQEAFDLVKRATVALVSGDGAAPARAIRVKAFEVLGRDSESLSERNFERILKDAHDQEVIDLRRRGNDYEVSMPAAVAPVSEQLNRAAAAHAAAAAAAAPVTPPAPRGMVPRSAPGRGGRRAPSGPPPELLLVGVVDDAPTSSSKAAAPKSAEPAAASKSVSPAESPKQAAPAAAPTGAHASSPAAEAVAKKPAKRGRARKTTTAKTASTAPATKTAKTARPAAKAAKQAKSAPPPAERKTGGGRGKAKKAATK